MSKGPINQNGKIVSSGPSYDYAALEIAFTGFILPPWNGESHEVGSAITKVVMNGVRQGVEATFEAHREQQEIVRQYENDLANSNPVIAYENLMVRAGGTDFKDTNVLLAAKARADAEIARRSGEASPAATKDAGTGIARNRLDPNPQANVEPAENSARLPDKNQKPKEDWKFFT